MLIQQDVDQILTTVLMLPKPDSCKGCLMYGDGMGFVPDDPDNNEPVLCLGQNPGGDEERDGVPFIGKTGEMLTREFFPRAGLVRGVNVRCANALKCRWIDNGKRTNNLPPAKVLLPALVHCTREHLHIGESVKLVVACGAVAWKAMNGRGTISEWRGFLKERDSLSEEKN